MAHLNKKAQQFSITTLIMIIIGVVALILVTLGLTQGFDKTLGRLNFLGGSDLQTFSVNCQQLASAHSPPTIDLSIDFCNDFKRVKLPSGDRVYINCEYPTIQNTIENFEEFNCEAGGVKAHIDFCQSVKEDDRVNTIVWDGAVPKTCKDILLG